MDNLYSDAYLISYREGDFSLERTPKTIIYNTEPKLYTVSEGELLTDIAFRELRDVGKWYLIALFNGIIDPFIEAGTTILIPPVYGQ